MNAFSILLLGATIVDPSPKHVFDLAKVDLKRCAVANYEDKLDIRQETIGGEKALVVTCKDTTTGNMYDTSWGVTDPGRFAVTPGASFAMRIRAYGSKNMENTHGKTRIRWYGRDGKELETSDATGKTIKLTTECGFRSVDRRWIESTVSAHVPDAAVTADIVLGADTPNVYGSHVVAVAWMKYCEAAADDTIAFTGDFDPPTVVSYSPAEACADFSSRIVFTLEDAGGIDRETLKVTLDGRDITEELSKSWFSQTYTYTPREEWKEGSLHRVTIDVADTMGNRMVQDEFYSYFTKKDVKHPKYTMRDDGMTLKDGVPFFPSGISSVRRCKQNGNDLKAAIRELKEDAKLNAISTYLHPWNDGEEYEELTRLLGEHGIGLIVEPAVRLDDRKNFKGEAARDAQMAGEVLRGRDLACTLGWEHGDDTAIHISPQQLRHGYRLCKAIDPYAIGTQSDICKFANYYKPYAPYADVFQLEIYPFCGDDIQPGDLPRVKHDILLAEKELTEVGHANRSIWGIGQVFDGWGWKHFPTEQELRVQVFMGITLGLRGYKWYAYCSGNRKWGAVIVPERWERFKRVTRELKRYEADIVSRDAKAQPTFRVLKGPAKDCLGQPSLSFLLKETGLLIGASDVLEPVTAEITMPDGTSFVHTFEPIGVLLSRSADFNGEISRVSAAGGGRVTVPAGVWRTGRIHLKSNVELHLEDGAVLRFTDDPKTYLPAVLTSWEGVECYNYSPLVYALDATNVAITGSGRLEAEMGTWRAWGGRRKEQAEAAKLKLVREWGPNDVPVAARDLTKLEGSNLRPPFIGFNRCRDVRLEGFAVRQSPFWCIHMLHCDGVTLRKLDLQADINNSDGANFESTRNVLVEDCVFDQGDDIICCKAGLDRDGRRRGIPTENVLVRRCVARRGHGLFTMGSECSGGIRNVTMEDCRIEGACHSLLNVKTRDTRGGFIENVTLRRVRADEAKVAAVVISARNDAWSRYQEGLEKCRTRISGIRVEDLEVKKACRKLDLLGDPEAPVADVQIRRVSVGETAESDRIENAEVKVADALSDELGFCRLSAKCANSSAVTVFNELEELDDRADRAWRALPDRAAYDAYRRTMRERMIAAFGGLPERTPLNAKTVATCRRDGYRIEKVIFESMPGLHVTANLFIPETPSAAAPYPAIVMSCGHSDEGKDCATYLHACVLAVRAGFVALMFDPYAQGERRVPGSTLNCCQHHNQIGFRAALLGGSAAQLRIWDAVRAIDYVESRPEVDRNRIGYMGQSGGGTMTALMTAVDPRLKATAPSCYLTSLTSLCEHMGPQDAEQNIFGQLTFGLNHTGYVLIPDIRVAITCKFSDMFTYYGTKKLFRTVEAVAEKVGSAGHYMLNDAPGPHGWTAATESASVEWMRAWLKDEAGRLPFDKSEFRARDLGFDIATDGELGLAPEERGCTPTKRTADLQDERGIFAILRDRLREAAVRRPKLPDGAARAALVKKIARIRTADETGVRVKELSQKRVDGCVVTHLAFLYPSGLALPAELVVHAGTAPKAVTVSVGRCGRTNAFENVRSELSAERAVLVADLTGLGDVGRAPYVFYGRKDLPEEGTSAMLYLMGESMVGRRATDLLVLAAELRRRGFSSVSLVAAGDVSIAAAHAHAAAPGAFAGVRLVDPAAPWSQAFDAARDGQTVLSYTTLVNGALRHYDWTELLEGD